MTIGQVDFGRLDAEREQHLQDYFVDTGVMQRIQSGKRQFIIGRKGSGKTALFRQLQTGSGAHAVVPLEFQDYAWEAHKRLKEDGVAPESSYTASWLFTLLINIVRAWATLEEQDHAKVSKKLLERIYGKDNPSWYHVLFDRVRRIRKLQLPGIEGVGELGGIEFDDATAPELVASSIGRWSKLLLEFVKLHYAKSPTTLLLDRLDEGWDGSEEAKSLLTGAVKAARELNIRLQHPGRPAPVILFLRSDIFHLLRFNDKNKMSLDIEFLEWSNKQLADVVGARIARSLGGDRFSAWPKAFSTEKMRQSATIQAYMLKRTMARPRDIVAFATFCQEVAVQRARDVVQTTDVYDAEQRYSIHIYDELDDELHKQSPHIRQSVQVLRDIGDLRFTYTAWSAAYKARLPSALDDEVHQRMRELVENSVIGIERRGGTTRGTEFVFAYMDRFLVADLSGQLIVHSSLKKALNLKDRGG